MVVVTNKNGDVSEVTKSFMGLHRRKFNLVYGCGCFWMAKPLYNYISPLKGNSCTFWIVVHFSSNFVLDGLRPYFQHISLLNVWQDIKV